MLENEKPKPTTKRIGGYLHRIVPILDSTGKVIHHVVKPFMVELKPRDILQIIIGATILAIPVAFTEEVWQLSIKLPKLNIGILALTSIIFISLFVYLNFYRFHLKEYKFDFIKRVLAIYFISLLIVCFLLIIIGQCPLISNFGVAIKRIIIVAFPSSMSASVSDLIK